MIEPPTSQSSARRGPVGHGLDGRAAGERLGQRAQLVRAADAVPLLRQDDDASAVGGGPLDEHVGFGEVLGLVGPARHLHARDADPVGHGRTIACARWRDRASGPTAVFASSARSAAGDFRLLWGGQTVSLIGNGTFFVAIGWRVTQLTGRASALPLVLMLYSVAQLATLLVGGALADRHERDG